MGNNICKMTNKYILGLAVLFLGIYSRLHMVM